MRFSAVLCILLPLVFAAPAPEPVPTRALGRRATGAFIELIRDTSQVGRPSDASNVQCLTVVQSVAGQFTNGDLVTNRACTGGRTGPQQWDISPGDGLIRVTGTNFCLDAGTNPRNNVPTKVCLWLGRSSRADLAMLPVRRILEGTDEQRSGKPAVVLYKYVHRPQRLTAGDNRIAITGGNQCLDQGPTGTQTYQCTTGNTNHKSHCPDATNSMHRPGSQSEAPLRPRARAALWLRLRRLASGSTVGTPRGRADRQRTATPPSASA
jgi:hypothetical protein